MIAAQITVFKTIKSRNACLLGKVVEAGDQLTFLVGLPKSDLLSPRVERWHKSSDSSITLLRFR